MAGWSPSSHLEDDIRALLAACARIATRKQAWWYRRELSSPMHAMLRTLRWECGLDLYVMDQFVHGGAWKLLSEHLEVAYGLVTRDGTELDYSQGVASMVSLLDEIAAKWNGACPWLREAEDVR